MKYRLCVFFNGIQTSLPTGGAWIEIQADRFKEVLDNRRSPQGERGLKYNDFAFEVISGESLPTGGAWIEIWNWA